MQFMFSISMSINIQEDVVIKEKKAAWIIPVKNELSEPNGEILYNSLILIVSIFLNLGAGLLVNKIGTSARESKIDTKINGS